MYFLLLSFQDVYESNYEVCLYGLHGLDINETNVMALLPKNQSFNRLQATSVGKSFHLHIDFRNVPTMPKLIKLDSYQQ